MNLHEIAKALEALVLTGESQLDRQVTMAFTADVMSDLLAFAKAGSLLLTRMTSPQVIRTSEILDVAAVVMVRGNVPAQDVLKLASELSIPVLSTNYVLFEAAGRLHALGLRAQVERVDAYQLVR